MSYIDCHCHLDGRHYGDLFGLFERIAGAGVEKLILAGVDAPTSEFNAKLCEIDDMYGATPLKLRFCAGFHPTELKNYSEAELEKIALLADYEFCVAIGEIGLDYHYPDTDKELQRHAFIAQLRLAHEKKLPVVIHSRDCAEDMLEILKKNRELLEFGALLHCYSHSPEMAVEFERLGCYFSFGGTSTYKNSKKAQRCIAQLPFDRILTETDSPYLPPASRRGEFPNTPESIPEILANIAHIRGVTVEEAQKKVWDNAHALFKKL